MDELVTETLAEVLALSLAAVGSGALALLGTLAELAALGDLAAGQTGIGLWELVFGALLLYAGVYLLGYRRLAVTLLDRRSART